MKYKNYILFGTVLALAIVAAFSVGKVYAGGGGGATGCFTDTNGNFAETAICWLFNNGITSGTAPGVYSPNNAVTRAQMAVFLQRIATFGETRISASLTDWRPNGTTPDAAILYYGAFASLKPGLLLPGDSTYQASLPMITALHSQQTILKGVELCYDATSGGYLSTVNIDVDNSTPFFIDTLLVDSTNRSDAACRTYTLSSPIYLNTTTTVSVVLTVHTTLITDHVDIWSMTAIEGGSTLPAGMPAPVTPSIDPADIPASVGATH